MIRNVFFIAIVIALGWLGSFYYRRYEVSGLQKNLHAQIAALRTYEEGYALRHAHYLLVPDSCKFPGAPAWTELGMAAPSMEKGCFRVESRATTYALSASATTSTSIQIVGVTKDGRLVGTESNDDKSPHWTTAEGAPVVK